MRAHQIAPLFILFVLTIAAVLTACTPSSRPASKPRVFIDWYAIGKEDGRRAKKARFRGVRPRNFTEPYIRGWNEGQE